MHLHLPWSRHYRAHKHTGSKYWSWTHSLESTPHPWLIFGLAPPAAYHAFLVFAVEWSLDPKKCPVGTSAWELPMWLKARREAAGEYSSQAAERGCSVAPSTLLGQKRGFQPTTLCQHSLGGYQAQGDQFLCPWFCCEGREDLHCWSPKFPYPVCFLFSLTHCGLTAHKVGATASAKKGTQENMGISFQLLLFPDFFKDKTMT